MTNSEYPLGSLVLAKVEGYPPWPAEVVDPTQFEQSPDGENIFVLFLQPKQTRFCSKDEVELFTGKARAAAIARTKTRGCFPDFKLAVAEALKSEKSRTSAGNGKDGEGNELQEGEKEAEEEAEEEDEEEEEEDTDEDFLVAKETTQKRTKSPVKQKTGQKRLKKDAVSAKPPVRPSTGKPPRPNMAAGKKKRATIDEQETIFSIVKSKRKLLEAAAHSWVEHYLRKPEESMAEVLTFLFQACGSRLPMAVEDAINEKDVDDVIGAMVETAKEGDVDDVLGWKQKDLKAFKQNMIDFWNFLVLEGQETVIFDDRMISQISSYVITLASTPPRAFRQMATLTALQLVSSLVTAGNVFAEKRETMQRQVNAEKKKKLSDARVEGLTKNLAEVSEKIASIEGMMRNLFTGVFMHRYRDVDPDIRVACISSLGSWIKDYPSLFLQDSYLKYIGWMLNDKVAAVRMSSVVSLQALYEVEDFIPSLGLFTERFRARMIEMADDIDVGVAVQSIQWIQTLIKNSMISEEDIVNLYDLLFDKSSQIRQAVGRIIFEQRMTSTKKSTSTSTKMKDPDKHPETQLRVLLDILSDYSGSPAAAVYVIDSMVHVPALQDWKCAVGLLLQERTSQQLSRDDTFHLVHILNSSAKIATGHKIIPSVDEKKGTISKAMKEAYQSSQLSFTTILMRTLPQLLKKNMADPEIVGQLADVIPILDLDLFSKKHEETNFHSILSLLEEAFFKHADEPVLQMCISAVSHCARNAHGDLKEASQKLLKEIGQSTGSKLLDSVQLAGKNLENDDDLEYSLTANLRRSFLFQMMAGMDSEDSFSAAASLLDSNDSLSDNMVRYALLNLFLQVTWSLSAIDIHSPAKGQLSTLTRQLAKLMDHLEASTNGLLETALEGEARLQLASQVVDMLSDTWCLFNGSKLKETGIHELGVSPSDSFVAKFWKLCELLIRQPESGTAEENEEEDSHRFRKEFVVLAAAKLITSGVLPPDNFLAGEIVSHYCQQGKGVADVVKTFCQKLKGEDLEIYLPDIFFNALKSAYTRHMEDVDMDDTERATSSESFLVCKDLASRLSSSFAGFRRNSSRNTVLRIVSHGLQFAFQDMPRQISFLEAGVVQFALKMGVEDLRKLIKEANSRVAGVDFDEDPSSWRPFVRVMEQLKDKAVKMDPAAAAAAGLEKSTPVRKQAKTKAMAVKPRGRKLSYGREDESESAEADEQDSEEELGEEEEDDRTEVAEEEEEIENADNSPLVPSAKTFSRFDRSEAAMSVRQRLLLEQQQRQLHLTPVSYSRKRKGAEKFVAESPSVPSPAASGLPETSRESAEFVAMERRSKKREDPSPSDEDDVIGTEEIDPTVDSATEEQLPGQKRRTRARHG